MKIIKRDLDKRIKELKILALSDWHVGDPLCNIEKIKAVLDQVSKEKNTYIILNGDLANNATKTSVSDVYGEVMTPMQEIMTITELLRPVKDKILVIAQGNHEARTYKQDGIDIMRIVARELGIEDRYTTEWWYLYLRFGLEDKRKDRQMMYTITGTHGYGGGRRMGGKINNLVEMSDKVIADLYIMGHTHTPIATRNSVFVPDPQHRTIIKKDKYYLMTNSFLEYGGYGEAFGYTPSTTDHQEAILDGGKKKIKIIM